jgi:hypothetical protein
MVPYFFFPVGTFFSPLLSISFLSHSALLVLFDNLLVFRVDDVVGKGRLELTLEKVKPISKWNDDDLEVVRKEDGVVRNAICHHFF